MPRWKHKNLHSCLEIPDKLVVYISDYKINVFEIAWMEPEQVKLFKSDFKIVADFFVQNRMNKSYNPSKDTIRHVDEVLKMMAVLTGDSRYEHAQQNFHKENKKKNLNMCEVLDKYINDRLQQSIQQGTSTGRHESAVEIAKRCLKMNITTDRQLALATELSMEEIQGQKKNCSSPKL